MAKKKLTDVELKEKKRLYDIEYRKLYKSRRQAIAKKYYKENKEKIYDYLKQYRIDNVEKEKIRVRKYCKANKEKIAIVASEWITNNPDKIKQIQKRHRSSKKRKTYTKKYNEEHKEKQKAYIQQYYLENKKRKLALAKIWKKQNKDYINKQKKLRLQTDVNFRILNNLRRRLHAALKGQNKSARTLELLGCTIEELKVHLESKFTENMNWQNYGLDGWVVDHRIPCASYDMIDPEQQKVCFNYSNLQPLMVEDNLAKGSKLNWTKT
ncbi:MAG TPA: hypothetical protein ENI61_01160 [Ignavibacteria bacterium]|nr:hypothetical protein [Ignavibacteria bacterium]